jgi:hypothetical protein
MRNYKFRHLFFAAAGFCLLAIIALWSFNTVADLLGGPSAQYKHAIAGVALLLITRWCLFSARWRHAKGDSDGH